MTQEALKALDAVEEAITENTEQLALLAKQPDDNFWVKQGYAAIKLIPTIRAALEATPKQEQV